MISYDITKGYWVNITTDEYVRIDLLVQERRNFTDTLELRLSSTNPSKWKHNTDIAFCLKPFDPHIHITPSRHPNFLTAKEWFRKKLHHKHLLA